MYDENRNTKAAPVKSVKKVKKKRPNTSGQGADCIVPEIVSKRFNWGAFFLTWIWGVCNKTYITLLIFLTLIPFVGMFIGLPLQIWFGIKGNEWAWKNKKFKGVNDFHRYQKNWAIAGTVLSLFFTALSIVIVLTLPSLMKKQSAQYNNLYIRKATSQVMQAVSLNYALHENKCELSSEGPAKCFENRLDGVRIGNTINDTFDSAKVVYTF